MPSNFSPYFNYTPNVVGSSIKGPNYYLTGGKKTVYAPQVTQQLKDLNIKGSSSNQAYSGYADQLQKAGYTKQELEIAQSLGKSPNDLLYYKSDYNDATGERFKSKAEYVNYLNTLKQNQINQSAASISSQQAELTKEKAQILKTPGTTKKMLEGITAKEQAIQAQRQNLLVERKTFFSNPANINKKVGGVPQPSTGFAKKFKTTGEISQEATPQDVLTGVREQQFLKSNPVVGRSLEKHVGPVENFFLKTGVPQPAKQNTTMFGPQQPKNLAPEKASESTIFPALQRVENTTGPLVEKSLGGALDFAIKGQRASEELARKNLFLGAVGSFSSGVIQGSVGLAYALGRPATTVRGIKGLVIETTKDPVSTGGKVFSEQKSAFFSNPASYAGSFTIQSLIFKGGEKIPFKSILKGPEKISNAKIGVDIPSPKKSMPVEKVRAMEQQFDFLKNAERRTVTPELMERAVEPRFDTILTGRRKTISEVVEEQRALNQQKIYRDYFSTLSPTEKVQVSISNQLLKEKTQINPLDDLIKRSEEPKFDTFLTSRRKTISEVVEEQRALIREKGINQVEIESRKLDDIISSSKKKDFSVFKEQKSPPKKLTFSSKPKGLSILDIETKKVSDIIAKADKKGFERFAEEPAITPKKFVPKNKEGINLLRLENTNVLDTVLKRAEKRNFSKVFEAREKNLDLQAKKSGFVETKQGTIQIMKPLEQKTLPKTEALPKKAISIKSDILSTPKKKKVKVEFIREREVRSFPRTTTRGLVFEESTEYFIPQQQQKQRQQQVLQTIQIQKVKTEQRLSPVQESLFGVKTGSKLALLSFQKQKQKFSYQPVQAQQQRVDQVVEQQVGSMTETQLQQMVSTKVLTKTKQKIETMPIQLTRQKQEQSFAKSLSLTLSLGKGGKQKRKDFTEKKPMGLGRLEEGFFPVLFRKGKAVRSLSSVPVTKANALAIGASFVDQSIKASFKIVPTGGLAPTRGFRGPTYILREGKRDRTLFVEKNKYRINTPTEVGELSFARQLKKTKGRLF